MAAAGNWERKVKDGAPSYSEQFRILKGCKDYDILSTPYAKPSPEAQVSKQQQQQEQQQQHEAVGLQQAAAAGVRPGPGLLQRLDLALPSSRQSCSNSATVTVSRHHICTQPT
jgi:hypothetical protein